MRTHTLFRTDSRGFSPGMWCGLCLVGWFFAVTSPVAWGQERKFPYEAIVDLDAEYVRCGPGPKYYPTDKLTRGQTVTVIRHDPGGWAMIAPPPESFSWINAEHVQRLDGNRGTLIQNNVIVHVGSKLGDERSVYQRTLSKNDTVEILGESKVTTERGPANLYRIKPPAREYRWIATKALVPASAFKGGPQGAPLKSPAAPLPNIRGPIAVETELPLMTGDDPFAPAIPVSSGPKTVDPGLTAPIIATPLPTGPSLGMAPPSVGTTPPVVGSIDPHRARFYEIDQQMRDMLKRDPLEWNLPALEQAFLELDKQPLPPNLHAQIQSRLRQLQKYSRMQRDFADLHQLTSETKKRDAQLVSMQRQTEEQLRMLENGQTPMPQPAPAPTPRPTLAPVTPRPSQPPGPGTATPVSNGPKPSAPPVTPRPANPAAVPKFDGAGIVQKRSDEGKPPFAIVAPDGRLLAYLQAPPELDLAPFVNFQMGVTGTRAFDPAVDADVIQVRGLQPVQLRQ